MGKKRLDKAIELHKKVVSGGSQDIFNITWHPFYLDPTMPKSGTPIAEKLAQRFGADQVARKQEQLERIGQCDGINFCTNNKIGNTRDEHRLLELARRKGVQHSVADALFRVYFEENGDITSHDTLLTAAENGGLAAVEAREYLSSDAGGDEVDREVEKANRAGIHGVPKFTFNEKFELDGAQEVQDFLEVLAMCR